MVVVYAIPLSRTLGVVSKALARTTMFCRL